MRHAKALGAFAAVLACVAITGCHSRSALAPTPTLYADTADDPFAQVPPPLQTTCADVVYATDRLVDADAGADKVEYGSERSLSLALGVCRVTFGTNLDWDGLVAASRSSRRTRPVELRLSQIDPRATFAPTGRPPRDHPDPEDVEADQRACDTLHALISARLACTPRKEVFLFVHGYDNTLEDAALRIAQIWHFLGRVGVPVVYSWPAGYDSLLHGYTRDRESGEFTVFHLKQFLRALAGCPGVTKVHMIAHSRGTDVLMTALRELHLEMGGETRARLRLGNVVLVAPDLDVDVAGQRIAAEGLGAVPERTTVYMNPEDRAINLAAWLFGSVLRLGQVSIDDMSPEVRAVWRGQKEVNFIDVHVTTDFWGHGYFTSNPSVLSDLILVLRDGRPPGAENGRPLVDSDGVIWELREGYPR